MRLISWIHPRGSGTITLPCLGVQQLSTMGLLLEGTVENIWKRDLPPLHSHWRSFSGGAAMRRDGIFIASCTFFQTRLTIFFTSDLTGQASKFFFYAAGGD
jgi:hypothetical protein